MPEKGTEEGIQGVAARVHDFSKPQSAAAKSLTRYFEDAYLNYIKAIQALYEEFQKRSLEMYSDYARALQEAWMHPDAQQRSEQAYKNYWQAVKQAWESSDFQARLDLAYREYVRALKAAWVGVDPATLDALSLGMIGHSIVSACGYANRTGQRPIERESLRS
jgi:hypothetical protein